MIINQTKQPKPYVQVFNKTMLNITVGEGWRRCGPPWRRARQASVNARTPLARPRPAPILTPQIPKKNLSVLAPALTTKKNLTYLLPAKVNLTGALAAKPAYNLTAALAAKVAAVNSTKTALMSGSKMG